MRTKTTSGLDTLKVSQRLGKIGIKHVVLDNEIILLGKVGEIKIANVHFPEAIYSTNPPKDNLMRMALFFKESDKIIDSCVDLSRVLDDKERIDELKSMIHCIDKYRKSFQSLVNKLSNGEKE